MGDDAIGLAIACLSIGTVVGACIGALLARPMTRQQVQEEIDTAFKVGWHSRNSQLAGLPDIDAYPRKA
jgi:Na+/glutamate symporter